MTTPNDPHGFMIVDAHGRLLRFAYDGKYYIRTWENAPAIALDSERKKFVSRRAYENALKKRNQSLEPSPDDLTYREAKRKLHRGGRIPDEWFQEDRN